MAETHPWDGTDERRKNMELRVLVDFISDFYVRSQKPSWECISETYAEVSKILHQDKSFHVPDKLLVAFDTNKRKLEQAFHPSKRLGKTGLFDAKVYLQKITEFVTRLKNKQPSKTSDRGEDDKAVKDKFDIFIRQFVVQRIEDHRILLLVLLTVIYRRLQTLSPDDLRTTAAQISAKLQSRYVDPERTMSLLIFEMCQSSVNSMDAVDYAQGMRMVEHAIEIYRMLPEDNVRNEIRTQIGETLRVSSERLVNRIQEKEQEEEVRIIEDTAGKLVNPDVIAYLLPQLVFFLIRAQRYEECLTYLDKLLNATITGEFMDYQTANTIGHYWCDALLKAERYSRGQVDFSYIEREKDNIQRVFDIASKVQIPNIEDETFYNVEVEKLAVTFSHLGTLFFQSGNLEMAARSYAKSFDVILTKRCSRNRDSVDEVLDRYKDTLFHPLNTAPQEAHPLIGLHASEKGYDFLLDSQIKKFEKEGVEFKPEEQNFDGLVNEQKQLIADLMDSTKNKLQHSFSERYAPYKPIIKDEFRRVHEKMKIRL